MYTMGQVVKISFYLSRMFKYGAHLVPKISTLFKHALKAIHSCLYLYPEYTIYDIP